ncbi:MAG: 3',5'-cyclic-AMP phosphodiesterase [Oceanicoccus sp.]
MTLQVPIDSHQPIKLLQITDTHLGAQTGETLLGLNTDYSLEQVVDLVRQEQPPVDLLLGTGDISSCGANSSYHRYRQLTKGLADQTLWLPGNHDSVATMKDAASDGNEMAGFATIGNWSIIMLNSKTPGEVGGSLTDEELDLLNGGLQQSRNGHALVCLHHHPISIGCDWLDEQRVSNADRLFSVLDEFAHVRGLLWGHVHQQIDRQRNGVKLMATPSTCIQFAADSADFKLDRLNPGYRWLNLQENGDIETGVSRVSGVEFDIDYNDSSGY